MSAASILMPMAMLILWTLGLGVYSGHWRQKVAAVRGETDSEKARHMSDYAASLPPDVRAIGENFNNLFQLPVVFYAIVLAVAHLQQVDMIYVAAAWLFVASRLAHTIIQLNMNIRVQLRTLVFVLGHLILIAMTLRLLWSLMAV